LFALQNGNYFLSLRRIGGTFEKVDQFKLNESHFSNLKLILPEKMAEILR
jgi:hypothetical protein